MQCNYWIYIHTYIWEQKRINALRFQGQNPWNQGENMRADDQPSKNCLVSPVLNIGNQWEDNPDMMYLNPNFLTHFLDAKLSDDQGWDARISSLWIGTWLVSKIWWWKVWSIRSSAVSTMISAAPDCSLTWRRTFSSQRIMPTSTIRIMRITNRCSRRNIRAIAILLRWLLSTSYPWKIVLDNM